MNFIIDFFSYFTISYVIYRLTLLRIICNIFSHTYTHFFFFFRYLEEQPLQQLGSVTPQLLMWNGRVGWYATMAQDPPEPPMIVPVNTLQADMRKILEDITTTDVTFLIGPTYEPIHGTKRL